MPIETFVESTAHLDPEERAKRLTELNIEINGPQSPENIRYKPNTTWEEWKGDEWIYTPLDKRKFLQRSYFDNVIMPTAVEEGWEYNQLNEAFQNHYKLTNTDVSFIEVVEKPTPVMDLFDSSKPKQVTKETIYNPDEVTPVMDIFKEDAPPAFGPSIKEDESTYIGGVTGPLRGAAADITSGTASAVLRTAQVVRDMLPKAEITPIYRAPDWDEKDEETKIKLLEEMDDSFINEAKAIEARVKEFFGTEEPTNAKMNDFRDLLSPVKVWNTIGRGAPRSVYYMGLTAINPLLGLSSIVVDESGSVLREMEDYDTFYGEEIDPKKKLAVAYGVGLVNGALEKIGIDEVLKINGVTNFKQKLFQGLFSIGVEDITEGLQGGVGLFGETLYNEFKEVGLEDYVDVIKSSMLEALPTTLLLSGGVTTISSFADPSVDNRGIDYLNTLENKWKGEDSQEAKIQLDKINKLKTNLRNKEALDVESMMGLKQTNEIDAMPKLIRMLDKSQVSKNKITDEQQQSITILQKELNLTNSQLNKATKVIIGAPNTQVLNEFEAGALIKHLTDISVAKSTTRLEETPMEIAQREEDIPFKTNDVKYSLYQSTRRDNQQMGDQSIVSELTEELFNKFMPKEETMGLTYDQYMDTFPNQNISLVSREGKGAWEFSDANVREKLIPVTNQQRKTTKEVKNFNDKSVQEHGSIKEDEVIPSVFDDLGTLDFKPAFRGLKAIWHKIKNIADPRLFNLNSWGELRKMASAENFGSILSVAAFRRPSLRLKKYNNGKSLVEIITEAHTLEGIYTSKATHQVDLILQQVGVTDKTLVLSQVFFGLNDQANWLRENFFDYYNKGWLDNDNVGYVPSEIKAFAKAYKEVKAGLLKKSMTTGVTTEKTMSYDNWLDEYNRTVWDLKDLGIENSTEVIEKLEELKKDIETKLSENHKTNLVDLETEITDLRATIKKQYYQYNKKKKSKTKLKKDDSDFISEYDNKRRNLVKLKAKLKNLNSVEFNDKITGILPVPVAFGITKQVRANIQQKVNNFWKELSIGWDADIKSLIDLSKVLAKDTSLSLGEANKILYLAKQEFSNIIKSGNSNITAPTEMLSEEAQEAINTKRGPVWDDISRWIKEDPGTRRDLLNAMADPYTASIDRKFGAFEDANQANIPKRFLENDPLTELNWFINNYSKRIALTEAVKNNLDKMYKLGDELPVGSSNLVGVGIKNLINRLDTEDGACGNEVDLAKKIYNGYIGITPGMSPVTKSGKPWKVLTAIEGGTRSLLLSGGFFTNAVGGLYPIAAATGIESATKALSKVTFSKLGSVEWKKEVKDLQNFTRDMAGWTADYMATSSETTGMSGVGEKFSRGVLTTYGFNFINKQLNKMASLAAIELLNDDMSKLLKAKNSGKTVDYKFYRKKFERNYHWDSAKIDKLEEVWANNDGSYKNKDREIFYAGVIQKIVAQSNISRENPVDVPPWMRTPLGARVVALSSFTRNMTNMLTDAIWEAYSSKGRHSGKLITYLVGAHISSVGVDLVRGILGDRDELEEVWVDAFNKLLFNNEVIRENFFKWAGANKPITQDKQMSQHFMPWLFDNIITSEMLGFYGSFADELGWSLKTTYGNPRLDTIVIPPIASALNDIMVDFVKMLAGNAEITDLIKRASGLKYTAVLYQRLMNCSLNTPTDFRKNLATKIKREKEAIIDELILIELDSDNYFKNRKRTEVLEKRLDVLEDKLEIELERKALEEQAKDEKIQQRLKELLEEGGLSEKDKYLKQQEITK